MNTPDGNPRDLLKKAFGLFQNGHNAEADALCQEILAIIPGQPNCLHLFGLIRFNLRDFRGAAEHLEKALETFPESPELHMQLGNAYVEVREFDQALALFDRAIVLRPAYPEVHFNRARVLERLGRLEAAEKELRAALDLRGDYVSALLNLGNVQKQLGRAPEAIETCREALRIRPDSPACLNNLGNLLADQGDMNEALESFRRAIEIDSGNSDAHNNLGQLLCDTGGYEEAAMHFQQANTPYARAKVAECLAHLARWEELDKYIAVAAEKDPRNLLMAAVSAYFSTGRGKVDPFPFCRDPLTHVRVRPDLGGMDDSLALIQGLKDDLRDRDAFWQPRTSSTMNGYQTSNDLFDNPVGNLAELERRIRREIAGYTREHAESDSLLIREFPGNYMLRGWFVRLLAGGRQAVHAHPEGWLSGVVYLEVPRLEPVPAGGIEFGLYSDAYPLLDSGEGQKVRHNPKVGDLVLFPSSLYHRTIPFEADTERLSIAFDVVGLR